MLKILIAFCALATTSLCLVQTGIAQTLKAQLAGVYAVQLSPSQQATLDRIEQLQTLLGGPWRVHAGDLPHGEAPALDDSSWPEANPHSTAPKEAVWYRRVVEVPKTLLGYDLTGVKVSFQFFGFTAGPLPEIVYYNGRRVALGEDLDAINLFANAKPGDKILIAVKLLPTPAPKKFYDVLMRISFAPNRPNPADLRDQLISAANLVPSLAPDSTSDRQTLLRSIDAIDDGALDRGDQRAFDDSLRKSAQLLAALRPLEQQVNYNLTGNSHIDAAWLWPWTETVDAVKRTFGTAAQLMQRVSHLHLLAIRSGLQPVDGRQVPLHSTPRLQAACAGGPVGAWSAACGWSRI